MSQQEIFKDFQDETVEIKPLVFEEDNINLMNIDSTNVLQLLQFISPNSIRNVAGVSRRMVKICAGPKASWYLRNSNNFEMLFQQRRKIVLLFMKLMKKMFSEEEIRDGIYSNFRGKLLAYCEDIEFGIRRNTNKFSSVLEMKNILDVCCAVRELNFNFQISRLVEQSKIDRNFSKKLALLDLLEKKNIKVHADDVLLFSFLINNVVYFIDKPDYSDTHPYTKVNFDPKVLVVFYDKDQLISLRKINGKYEFKEHDQDAILYGRGFFKFGCNSYRYDDIIHFTDVWKIVEDY
jgi:hypothetical protein